MVYEVNPELRRRADEVSVSTANKIVKSMQFPLLIKEGVGGDIILKKYPHLTSPYKIGGGILHLTDAGSSGMT